MKRHYTLSALSVLALLGAAVLHADVKTTERSTFKLEGMMGRLMGMMGGGGDSSATVAIKGTRMSRIDMNLGQIIDLGAETITQLDVKKKEYRVMTFAQMREQWKKVQADLEKQRQQMPAEDKQALEEAGTQLEFTADVKETGARKSLAGYETRQVILTITGHQKGVTVEAGGGVVLTTDLWLAPRIAALDEQGEFMLKFAKAVYGENFGGDVQRMATAITLFPALKPLSEKLNAERAKVQGTPLMSVTTFETVKSPEQMKQAQQSSGGGGLSGMLAKKMMGNKGAQQRSTVLTSSQETLSIATAATDADVTVPAGFKEKK